MSRNETAVSHSGSSGRVGMVGAGQLARMSQQAAIGLGIELIVLAESDGDPAVTAGSGFELASPAELDDLRRLAARSDVVTFDHEQVEQHDETGRRVTENKAAPPGEIEDAA